MSCLSLQTATANGSPWIDSAIVTWRFGWSVAWRLLCFVGWGAIVAWIGLAMAMNAFRNGLLDKSRRAKFPPLWATGGETTLTCPITATVI